MYNWYCSFFKLGVPWFLNLMVFVPDLNSCTYRCFSLCDMIPHVTQKSYTATNFHCLSCGSSKETSFEDTTKHKPVPSYSLPASSLGVFIFVPISAWATNQNDAILYNENAFVLGDPLLVGLEIRNCNPDDKHNRDNTADVTKWSFVSSIYWWQNSWRSLVRW